MFETKQYCGFISLKRDMLYYVRCIYTVSSLILTDDSASIQLCTGRWEVHSEWCVGRRPRVSTTVGSSKSRRMSVSFCQCLLYNLHRVVQLCMHIDGDSVTCLLHFCADSCYPFNMQLHFGSGFVLEPYGVGDNQTLISYLADVRIKLVHL